MTTPDDNEAPRFITFEGPEGAGKTTQCRLLAEWLRNQGVDVLVTRQPGGDPVGQKLRAILLDPGGSPVTPEAELLMMMADRSQSVANVIKPHLNTGGVVICDRYIDSSVAYQGYGRGIELRWVDLLNEFVTGGLAPQLTVLLDIDPALGLARQPERTRMELEAADFHRRVHRGFLEIAMRNPVRVVRVDASGSVDNVAQQVRLAYETHHRDRTGSR